MTKKPMTAEHDGKTYVASHSLDERLKRTEKIVIFHTILLYIQAIIILTAVIVKWDIVLKILLS